MNNLKDIQTYWETNTIYKEAGSGIVKSVIDGFAKGAEKTAKLAKDLVVKPAVATLPLTAMLAAVAYNKIKSPTVVAKNMDKRLLLNSLDTEIAVARRQIAELEAKRNKEAKDKPYDRFV